MTATVVITRRPPGDVVSRLGETFSVRLWPQDRIMPRKVLVEWLADAAGLYCMLTDLVDAELLGGAGGLKVVSNMAVGVDNIDVAACTQRGIPVGHTPDVLTETTADTAFALLLAAARRLSEGIDYVRAGKWQRWEPELLFGQDIHGAVLGIVGFGRIGRSVARRAKGFGMEVVYTGRRRHPEAEADVDARFLPLTELLTRADHIVVATALTPETTHLIDAEALSVMKRTATLVNISRGPTVDQEALYKALRDGRIGAAGLDVTDPEPIDPADPILDLPNCIVIPHLGSSTARTRIAMADVAGANLVAGVEGERLPSCVNPEVYR